MRFCLYLDCIRPHYLSILHSTKRAKSSHQPSGLISNWGTSPSIPPPVSNKKKSSNNHTGNTDGEVDDDSPAFTFGRIPSDDEHPECLAITNSGSSKTKMNYHVSSLLAVRLLANILLLLTVHCQNWGTAFSTLAMDQPCESATEKKFKHYDCRPSSLYCHPLLQTCHSNGLRDDRHTKSLGTSNRRNDGWHLEPCLQQA